MDNKRILFTNETGGVSIVVPAPGCTVEQALAAVPAGAAYEIVDVAAVPSDRTFRDAWFHDTTPEPQKIGIDIDKAKEHCHCRRRSARSAEFAPLDIKATIPGEAKAAEESRAAIRTKYTDIQAAIDACSTADELKGIIVAEGL